MRSAPVIGNEPGIDAPPVWRVVNKPAFLASDTMGIYSDADVTAPKPAFASQTPFERTYS